MLLRLSGLTVDNRVQVYVHTLTTIVIEGLMTQLTMRALVSVRLDRQTPSAKCLFLCHNPPR